MSSTPWVRGPGGRPHRGTTAVPAPRLAERAAQQLHVPHLVGGGEAAQGRTAVAGAQVGDAARAVDGGVDAAGGGGPGPQSRQVPVGIRKLTVGTGAVADSARIEGDQIVRAAQILLQGRALLRQTLYPGPSRAAGKHHQDPAPSGAPDAGDGEGEPGPRGVAVVERDGEGGALLPRQPARVGSRAGTPVESGRVVRTGRGGRRGRRGQGGGDGGGGEGQEERLGAVSGHAAKVFGPWGGGPSGEQAGAGSG